jgi:hypothetical protein
LLKADQGRIAALGVLSLGIGPRSDKVPQNEKGESPNGISGPHPP